ncbi:hypothetical protein H6G25_12905 [Dolichospermum sp. FACHB-1091]|uniref:hypothetical protein n=1 Tax=Dolichospermum sp. FACHB-1091 TaxID=2692798 RepID=UPI0016818EAB|nr:hypothetical protein [Dolichospermum sp. FACHB-1091]MBD2444066.1 hypothetical protein [Dolichospermum sp. FACHB-1091]
MKIHCTLALTGLGLALLTPFTIVSVPEAASAINILSTNFNGRTVSGATASNLNWTTNGVSDPGNLTANFPLFKLPTP